MASHSYKRNRPDSDSDPDNLDTVQRIHNDAKETWNQFFELTSTDDQLLITKLSPFAIDKAIRGMVGIVKAIKKIRKPPGSLLIEVATQTQSQNITKIKQLANIPVTVKAHKTFNSSKGVIKTRELDDLTEEEILNYLATQNITTVERIIIRKNGSVIPTGTYILTFGSPKLYHAGIPQDKSRNIYS